MTDQTPPASPRRTAAARAFRLVRVALYVVLGFEAFYLVAMNVFLATPLFGKVVNAEPLDVDIHYGRAWSLFPTHVTARDLSIRGTDGNVQWILHLDEVTFDCALLELPKQRFHVTRARGSGITFRMRLTMESPRATEEYLAEIPPIDGLGAVGFKPSEGPYKGTWSDADWHLWTVQLDDVVAEHVRELWIDRGRFRGDARIGGGFYLRPIRKVEVGPIDLDVRSGSAAFVSRTVLAPLALRARMHLAAFDPRTAAGTDLLDRLSIDADAEATVPELADLPLSLPASARVRGRLDLPHVAVRLGQGVLHDGTHVDARAETFALTFRNHAATAGLTLRADVAQDELRAEVNASGVDVDRTLQVPILTLTLDSKALALADPLADLHAVLDLPDAAVTDVRRLGKLLPGHDTLALERGDLHASAHVEAWRQDPRISGHARVRASDLQARAGKLRVHATADASASLGALYSGQALDWESGSVTLDGREVSVRNASAPAAKGPAALLVERMTLAAKSPHLNPSDPLTQLDVVGSLSGGKVTRSTVLQDLFPGSAVSLVAEKATFDADVAMAIAHHVARGAASLNARSVGVAAKKLRLEGDATIVADVERWDLTKHALQGGVQVALDHVEGSFDPSRPATDFSADRVDARASARDLALDHPTMRDVDYSVHVGRAALKDATVLQTFLPNDDIFAIESGSAVLSADFGTSRSDHSARGNLGLWLEKAAVRLHETRLSGDFTLEVAARGFDPDKGELNLESSRLAMRNVTVRGAFADASAWSGDLVLQEGTLSLASTPRLEGDLTLDARDANPLLAVLLGDSVPKFVAALARMQRLSAFTHVLVEPDKLVVSDLSASGGDLAVRGVYVLDKQDRRAAFVVEKGPFAAGIRLANDGAHLRLFGLNDWFRAQLRSATNGEPGEDHALRAP